MTAKRLLLVLALSAGLAGVAYVARDVEPPGTQMAGVAEKFVEGLTPEQKKKAVYDFDSKERTNWHFIPLQTPDKRPSRKGLPLEEMSAEQKRLARELVRAGTSETGYDKAITIMSLESILHDLEKRGSMVRNPEWYFFTIFGTPSKTGKWGWRVEGHHLSLNFVVDRGKVTAATPAFFGANPANPSRVKGRDGKPVLAEAENLAMELFKSLDADQRKVALQPKQFPEIKAQNARPEVGEPVGLVAAKMTEEQRGILRKLIEGYARRMPPEVANRELGRVKQAGLDRVHFAFAGADQHGKPHTYRVQGPTFVIEFLNVQADSAGNPANHIHSVWRNKEGDFGLASR
jgi:hypothetical protein